MKSNVNNAINTSSGVSATRGHLQDNGGLRGHSVGDLFPLMVVGVGTQWEVQLHGKTLYRHWDLPLVHAAAGMIKEGQEPVKQKARVRRRNLGDTVALLAVLDQGIINGSSATGVASAYGMQLLRNLKVIADERLRKALDRAETEDAKAWIVDELKKNSRAISYLDWVAEQTEGFVK